MASNIIYLGELIKAFEAAGITVERDTRTGYFNATRTLTQWNANAGQKKRLDVFLKTHNTVEFIAELEEQERLHLESNRLLDKALVAVKGGDLAERQQGTWMHPLLFMKFAGWLNVKLEIMVYRIVLGVMDGTLIIQSPIYAGRDRKEVTVEANQPLQILPYKSEDYLLGRKAEFGW